MIPMKKTTLLLALALAGWMSTASAHGNGGGNGGGGGLSGTFTSSDGTTGTYVETKTTVGDVTTDTIALTDPAATTTGSYTVTTTVNSDGTRTVVYSDLALGATVPTVLTLTLPAVTASTGTAETMICGNASVSLYATGTLTSVAGLLDTLNAFVTLAGGDTVASLDFSTTLIGLARELFVVSNNGPSKVITTIDVSLAGVATTTKLTLTATGSMHHHMH